MFRSSSCSVALWLLSLTLGSATAVAGQAVSSARVAGGVPARFERGDTLTVGFRFEVPDSVDVAAVRILLLSEGVVVERVRRVRPEQARGSGEGEAAHVFTGPMTADGVRIVLSGAGGFLQQTDLPIGVASLRPELRRPGWIDPDRGSSPNGPGPLLDPDREFSDADVRLVTAVIAARDVTSRTLAAARWDTVSADQAVRLSPGAIRALPELLARQRARLAGRSLTELAVPGAGRLVRPPAEPRPTPPAAQPDTTGVPGPWMIEPDGSMRRRLPGGGIEIVDPSGQAMTCEPDPVSGELQCLGALAIQIPRVVPSSEIATIDLPWLESMDAWIEKLAEDALLEMRALVADEPSIQNYLALEEGENLYQRLDRRLEFLGRLVR